jgi:hypothetical protein
MRVKVSGWRGLADACYRASMKTGRPGMTEQSQSSCSPWQENAEA